MMYTSLNLLNFCLHLGHGDVKFIKIFKVYWIYCMKQVITYFQFHILILKYVFKLYRWDTYILNYYALYFKWSDERRRNFGRAFSWESSSLSQSFESTKVGNSVAGKTVRFRNSICTYRWRFGACWLEILPPLTSRDSEPHSTNMIQLANSPAPSALSRWRGRPSHHFIRTSFKLILDLVAPGLLAGLRLPPCHSSTLFYLSPW